MFYVRHHIYSGLPNPPARVVAPLRRRAVDTDTLAKAEAAGIRRMYKLGYRLDKARATLLSPMPGSVFKASWT